MIYHKTNLRVRESSDDKQRSSLSIDECKLLGCQQSPISDDDIVSHVVGVPISENVQHGGSATTCAKVYIYLGQLACLYQTAT